MLANLQHRLILAVSLVALSAHTRPCQSQAKETPPQAATSAAPQTSETKAAKPRNRTGKRKMESAITGVERNGGVVRITLLNGGLTLALQPATELVQEERALNASDLKTGDKLSLITLKNRGTLKEPATVTSINPLVLQLGEVGTFQVSKVEDLSFNRYTPLPSSALIVGQTVAVELLISRDGQIEAKRIAVVVVKPKPPRATKSRKTTSPKAE